jgi:hypothetical protein
MSGCLQRPPSAPPMIWHLLSTQTLASLFSQCLLHLAAFLWCLTCEQPNLNSALVPSNSVASPFVNLNSACSYQKSLTSLITSSFINLNSTCSYYKSLTSLITSPFVNLNSTCSYQKSLTSLITGPLVNLNSACSYQKSLTSNAMWSNGRGGPWTELW